MSSVFHNRFELHELPAERENELSSEDTASIIFSENSERNNVPQRRFMLVPVARTSRLDAETSSLTDVDRYSILNNSSSSDDSVFFTPPSSPTIQKKAKLNSPIEGKNTVDKKAKKGTKQKKVSIVDTKNEIVSDCKSSSSTNKLCKTKGPITTQPKCQTESLHASSAVETSSVGGTSPVGETSSAVKTSSVGGTSSVGETSSAVKTSTVKEDDEHMDNPDDCCTCCCFRCVKCALSCFQFWCD